MQPLQIILASPRGFCAGVDRAIQIVEKSLEKYGAPVYVRHEIVHNRFVVESLEAKGAIFVKELDDIPETNQPVIFSAHGVPKIIPKTAQSRNLLYYDATCPLVSKVHREVERHYSNGYTTILIGHANHPEVIGTMGQVPESAVVLVETVLDVESLHFTDSDKLAYATQTTLSIDEVTEMVAALKSRYPSIMAPKKEDICYATTNRQHAIKNLAPQVDKIIVIGSPNSSNSLRLVEVAKQAEVESILLPRAKEMDWNWLAGVSKLGLSAWASAPEELIHEFIEACRERFDVLVSQMAGVNEDIFFDIPKKLYTKEEPHLGLSSKGKIG